MSVQNNSRFSSVAELKTIKVQGDANQEVSNKAQLDKTLIKNP